jgi:Entner-Doudoroff aldolase
MLTRPGITRSDPGSALSETRIVAVVRGGDADRTLPVLETLVDAGIRCLEVTMNTPGALATVRSARASLDRRVEVGVGTVLSPEEVDGAADAGADFIVCPDTRAEVAERASARGLAYYPGALTPTEIGAAWDLGAAAVKVFPAGRLGAAYLRELRGPFPEIRLLPTGGIGSGNAREFLDAGAIAVGVGGSLIGNALTGGSLADLRARAEQLVSAVGAGNGR